MGLKVGEVKLEKYNEEWEDIFEKEREELVKIFEEKAIIIEHIGSTSVPGLSAKSIIDIAVGVLDLNDFEEIKDKCKEQYSIKENPTKGEELIIKRENNDITTHLIHVMEVDSKRCRDTILFRNYLRTHDDVLKEYENLKKKLAKKYKNDRPKYTASKNDFIQEVIIKAYEEI